MGPVGAHPAFADISATLSLSITAGLYNSRHENKGYLIDTPGTSEFLFGRIGLTATTV